MLDFTLVDCWTYFLLLSSVGLTAAQDCLSTIPGEERRECFPWGSDGSLCVESGCTWCEGEEVGPWCFMNDDVCPSLLAEADRQDCHPEEGANRNACLQRGCAWCVVTTPDIPWCFHDDTVNQGGDSCSTIGENDRVDCSPGKNGLTREQCINKGCYFCESETAGVPWCYTPREHGYRMVGEPVETPIGYVVNLQRKNYPSWFGEDVHDVRLEVEFQEDYRLRLKFTDPNTSRFEVPAEVVNILSPETRAPAPLYAVEFTAEPSFSVQVKRADTGEVLLDTSLGGFQFAEQFLQFSTKLPTANVYGFAETEHYSFRHDMNWKKWGMFGRDEPVNQNNLYSVHPYYNVLDSENNMMGVLILNSNAQEVEVTPSPGLIYRTLGGILDLYLFLGPSPEQVTSQYLQAVGLPMMPPYWTLGFHLSRYGYNSLDAMKAAVNRLREYDIPHDCQYADIDTFDRRLDFTYDQVNFASLPEYVMELKEEGTSFVTILDPPISIGEPAGSYPPFDRGQEADVWTKESDGVLNAEATAWPDDNVYFPDYWSKESQEWWTTECLDHHGVIAYDGLWLDMNEPASFVDGSVHSCYNKKENHPLFRPVAGDVIFSKTLCLDYLSTHGILYDTHNLYGFGHVLATVNASRMATGGRGFIVSRSTFPGVGQYTGHWLGDNYADWSHMKNSIIGSLEFNLFGMPYVGADICGFYGDSYETLCQRWMELGAFYTFSRNHNGLGWTDQDPGVWPSVGAASRKALSIRYKLLPYLYTLFHEAHTVGSTVMRPLLHEFVNEVSTHGLDEQFLWGPALLISPVLEEDTTELDVYLPDARWYDLHTGNEEVTRGNYVTLQVPLDTIALHYRGGYILPQQQSANSTKYSRGNRMSLVAALDDEMSSTGSLFWDDGISLGTFEQGVYYLAEYHVQNNTLTADVIHDGYPGASSLLIYDVTVLGAQEAVTRVTVYDDVWPDQSWSQDPQTGALYITDLNINLPVPFDITWIY